LLSIGLVRLTQEKDCFGATPKPARETRALPRLAARLVAETPLPQLNEDANPCQRVANAGMPHRDHLRGIRTQQIGCAYSEPAERIPSPPQTRGRDACATQIDAGSAQLQSQPIEANETGGIALAASRTTRDLVISSGMGRRATRTSLVPYHGNQGVRPADARPHLRRASDHPPSVQSLDPRTLPQ